jgi:hypothetical protein
VWYKDIWKNRSIATFVLNLGNINDMMIRRVVALGCDFVKALEDS